MLPQWTNSQRPPFGDCLGTLPSESGGNLAYLMKINNFERWTVAELTEHVQKYHLNRNTILTDPNFILCFILVIKSGKFHFHLQYKVPSCHHILFYHQYLGFNKLYCESTKCTDTQWSETHKKDT